MDLTALLSEGLRHHTEGRLDSARNIYEELLKRDPRHADALHHLGLINLQFGAFSQAIEQIRSSLLSDPSNSSALTNLAHCLNLIGDHQEARKSCEAALEIDPDDDAAWTNLGNAQRGLRCFAKAKEGYERALALDPGNPRYLYNVGLALFDQGHLRQSREYFTACLAIDPRIPEANHNLAACLLKLHEPSVALNYSDAAIQLHPDYAEAWLNRGAALNDLRRYEEALASYQRCIELKPDWNYALAEFVHMQMILCHWANFDDRCESLRRGLSASNRASSPFPILGLFDDPHLHRVCADQFAQNRLGLESELGSISRRGRRSKIRVGYFSADFHDHATMHLMAHLFECHNRERFEIFGFSFGPGKDDAMRIRARNGFDSFFDVSSLSDISISSLAREHQIDIAVDLKGYTQDSRPAIFAYQAAPIQVSYLGFPGTMGTPKIDYLIADPVLIPEYLRSAYTEKIIYLPNSYQVNDSQRAVSNRVFARAELGLPESGFVFCCFNNSWKILPEIFDAWVRIMQSVPDSVLWLYEDNPPAARNLRAEAEKRHIDPRRLVFAKHMPHAEHLARYRLADLFLDTFPYGAHTTASDALWVGCPVLTRTGESFASRVASSLLHAIGLPELITHTTEKYESLAIELTKNPERITSLKARLAENRAICPLFNTALFTQHIESAYQAAYDRYHEGLAPDHIYVDG